VLKDLFEEDELDIELLLVKHFEVCLGMLS